MWGSATETGNGTGWLARVDRASGATTTLSTGLSLSWSLAGLDDTLVFSNRTDDGSNIELRTIAKAGGASTAISTGLDEHAKILTDAGGIAWVESTGDGVGDFTRRLVYRAGDVKTELARGHLVTTALARHGDTFYFADDTRVLSVPRTGGAPAVVAVAPRVVEVFADACSEPIPTPQGIEPPASSFRSRGQGEKSKQARSVLDSKVIATRFSPTYASDSRNAPMRIHRGPSCEASHARTDRGTVTFGP